MGRKRDEADHLLGVFMWTSCTQGISVQEEQANGGMRCGEAGMSTGEAAAEQPNVERTSVQ